MIDRSVAAFLDWINDERIGGWAFDMSRRSGDIFAVFDDPLGRSIEITCDEFRSDLQNFKSGHCGFSFNLKSSSINEIWRLLAIGRRTLPFYIKTDRSLFSVALSAPFYKECVKSQRVSEFRRIHDHGKISVTGAGRLYVGRQDKNRTLSVFAGDEIVSDAVVEHWIKYIKSLKKLLDVRGAKFLFCIVPAKEIVESDALNIVPSNQRPVARILNQLSRDEIECVLYNSESLTREHYIRDVFHSDDTHLNGRGLMMTYWAICNRLKIPYEHIIRQDDISVRYEITKGDLSQTASKLGIDLPECARSSVKLHVDNAQIENMGHLYEYQDTNDYMETYENSNPTSIFVVGRSPAIEMMPLIAKTFGKTFRNKGVYPDLAALNEKNYTHVLTIISERHLNSVLSPEFIIS